MCRTFLPSTDSIPLRIHSWKYQDINNCRKRSFMFAWIMHRRVKNCKHLSLFLWACFSFLIVFLIMHDSHRPATITKYYYYSVILLLVCMLQRLLYILYIWLSAKRCACKGLCTSIENKTLLKTVFIWNVVLCTCIKECIVQIISATRLWLVSRYSHHTLKKRQKMTVPSDYRHSAYKQTASTWRNNHWFVRGKHRFIRII